jgi:hypothetical protein
MKKSDYLTDDVSYFMGQRVLSARRDHATMQWELKTEDGAVHMVDDAMLSMPVRKPAPIHPTFRQNNNDHQHAAMLLIDRIKFGKVVDLGQSMCDFLQCHVGISSVNVFVVVDDQPTILTDPIEMFPSDALIAQMRLILK